MALTKEEVAEAANDSNGSEQKRGGYSRALDRGLDVLFCIAESQGPISLAEIAQRVELDKTTTLRMVRGLAARGLVNRDLLSQRYSLGFKVLDLAERVARGLTLHDIALPYMHELRDRFGETAGLAIRNGDQRVYVAQVESPHELRWSLQIGRPAPLYVSSTGKAILSAMTDAEIEEIMRSTRFESHTRYTVATVEQLRASIEGARRLGYAVNREERQYGVAGLASVLTAGPNKVVGAISLAGPVHRFDEEAIERMAGPLMEAAREISARLSQLAQL